MRLVTFFIMFLFLSMFMIISNENLALKDSDSRMEFGRIYYAWILGLFDNVKSITGEVISADWIPKMESYSNLTNFSNVSK